MPNYISGMSTADNPFISDFFSGAEDLTPIGNPNLTVGMGIDGEGGAPFFNLNTANGPRYFVPAFGRESGRDVMDSGGEGGSPSYRREGGGGYDINPWLNWSNDFSWTPDVSGMTKVRAPWAEDLVKGLPYQGPQEYTGYGWMGESPPQVRTVRSEPEGSWWEDFTGTGTAAPDMRGEGLINQMLMKAFQMTPAKFALGVAGTAGSAGGPMGADTSALGGSDLGPTGSGGVPSSFSSSIPDWMKKVFDTSETGGGGPASSNLGSLAYTPGGNSNDFALKSLSDSGITFPGLPTSGAPVEDRSPKFGAKGGFIPDSGNAAAFLASRAGFGPSTAGTIGNLTPGVGSLWSGLSSIGSGLYGLAQQKKLRQMAQRAFDPVRELQANPGLVTSQPGYQFGLDEGRRAIARQGAASGGGGNEAIAAARYTPEYAQKFYESEMARRMQLAQASGGMNLSAAGGANNLASSALASIGYGGARMFGGSSGLNDDYLRSYLSRIFSGSSF